MKSSISSRNTNLILIRKQLFPKHSFSSPYSLSSNDYMHPQEQNYGEITVKELAGMWKHAKIIHIKRSTALKYDEIIDKHINPVLGNYPVSWMNTNTIRDFVLEKQKEGRLDGKGGLSSSYVRTIGIVLKSIIEYGSQESYCPSISLKHVIPSASNKSPKTLTRTEQKQLEKYLLEHFSPTSVGIFLALRAGLRIGEVCALSKDDINLEEKLISVRHTAVRVKGDKNETSYILDSPKTKTSVRDIPIADMLYQSLCALSRSTYGVYVASGCDNFVSPPTFEYRYHRILEKAGISRINFHALRHTFATRCIESGMDDKSLSEILGHSSVNITLNTYVHSSMALKRAQIERFCEMMSD